MRNVSTLFLLALLAACSNGEPMGHAQLQDHVSATENGLTRMRKANGIRTTVSLTPPVVGALREAGDSASSERMKELVAAYSRQLYFVVNLSTDEDVPTSDVMLAGAQDMSSYKQQAYALNFGWSEMAVLRCGGTTYSPKLSTLENTYGLSKDRNVVLVFTPDGPDDREFFSSPIIELEITNDLFGTGIQSFKFQRDDLDRVAQALDRT